jgi:enamine deaminase RidA (YjgF/YER057c/UK114 family)
MESLFSGRATARLTKLRVLLAVAVAACLSCGASYAQQTDAEVEYVNPDPKTGTSQATVVGDVPLAHTDQFLPLDAEGELVEGGARQQIDRVLENLRLALSEVGAGLEDIAKINVYAAQNDVVQQVKEQFAETFSGEAKPAVAYMVGRLPRSNALVAMDAVAAGASPEDEALRAPATYQGGRLPGAGKQGDVAVMPRGETVYVSGQADLEEENLLEAVRGTMQSLHATLAYQGLSAEDVVQVKAFIRPVEQAQKVERVIAEYYQDKLVPPVVSVEWLHGGLPTEIELIASSGAASDQQASSQVLSFITPPGMSSASTFSRMAQVHRGDLVYTSGLYGPCSQSAEEQVRTIFDKLGGVLEKTGSDFERLAKATYYYTTDAASEQLNEIRPEFYDPKRPPAASKIVVRGVGKEGCSVTTDMIAVSPD